MDIFAIKPLTAKVEIINPGTGVPTIASRKTIALGVIARSMMRTGRAVSASAASCAPRVRSNTEFTRRESPPTLWGNPHRS